MYRLSKKAELDLKGIFRHSLLQFGVQQSEKYISNLLKVLDFIVGQPNIGMDCDYIRVGLYRYIYQSHTIYYKKQQEGILVVRILHNKMQHKNYF